MSWFALCGLSWVAVLDEKAFESVGASDDGFCTGF